MNESVIFQGLSDESFVRYCYIRLLNREPDNEGFQHYLQLLNYKSRIQVISKIMNSEEYQDNNINPSNLPFKTHIGWKGRLGNNTYKFTDPSMFGIRARESRFFTEFLKEVKKSGVDKVADLGSHKGAYSAISSFNVQHTDCFELNPQLIPALRINLSVNNLLEGVEINQKAVCETEGNVQAHLKKDSYRSKIGEGDSIVFSTSLDTYYKGRKLPDVLKIDVEGAETRVLEGMQNLLSSNKDIKLFIELHGTESKVVDYLKDRNMSVDLVAKSNKGDRKRVIAQ